MPRTIKTQNKTINVQPNQLQEPDIMLLCADKSSLWAKTEKGKRTNIIKRMILLFIIFNQLDLIQP